MMIRPLAAATSLVFLVAVQSLVPSAEREVEIVGFDYAFKAPAELPPGRTVFQFVNQGKVRHEFNILRLARGVSMQRFNAATSSDTTPPSTISAMIDANVGVLFADGLLRVTLLPGRQYVIVCTLSDSAKPPPHIALGMIGSIRVTGGASQH